MMHFSNKLMGILNIITLLFSIPIIGGGIWLSRTANTDCERFLDKPVIVLGAFILVVSLAGIIGSFCRKVSFLLWAYLIVMFLLILLLCCFTIFAFVVTKKGAGHEISGKGYKEYRLEDYSNWLQNRVNNNWPKISSCVAHSKTCQKLLEDNNTSAKKFYARHLSALQSGCCKPSNDCNFSYITPTNWTTNNKPTRGGDCAAWNNASNQLCYQCDACKAGLLDTIKRNWRKVAVINVVFLIFLFIMYTVGCCAFRNNKDDNNNDRNKKFPYTLNFQVAFK